MRSDKIAPKNYLKFVGVSGFALLMALATTTSAAAQVQSTESIDNEDVVVTVERRAQSLQDYAGTAAVISGEELSLLGINNVNELDGKIPGVSIANNAGNCLLYTSPSPRDS